MSRRMRNGLWVAALHVAIVASLGGKLLYERTTRPRVWVRAAPVDPNLPIRGRYVRLRIEATPSAGLNLAASAPLSTPVTLGVRDGQLVAEATSASTGLHAHAIDRDGRRVAVLEQPLAYFIPEHVPDPLRLAAGEELWVEVTLPIRGAPRPIRLGVKKAGVLTPLELNYTRNSLVLVVLATLFPQNTAGFYGVVVGWSLQHKRAVE